jgi:PAS domain S-box-containing protein
MENINLKILCLEDVESDAIIIREILAAEGLSMVFDHVSAENEFKDKLSTQKYDIILSDYNLPGFSGIAALMLSQKICPEVPFICISGTIGEDLAVELMHLGASDYILKDRLFKLPIALQRVLNEKKVERAKAIAEIELRESEEKYKNLVENINDVVYEIDNSGIIQYMSPIIKEITGFPDSYFTGKPLFEFINEKDLNDAYIKFKNIITEGMINPFEFRISDSAGKIIWLRTSSKQVINEGNVIGIRGIAIDITKSKMADEQIRKLSRAIEQSPASVIITDTKGSIEYINPKFTELTGYSLAEALGKNPRFMKSGHTKKNEYENLWRTIISGEEWRGEFHNKRKDGSLYWEQASISSIKDFDGKITHFLAVKEDITEKKRIINELISAKDKAEESSRLKSAFLSNISHEIRTPLNGIIGFADLLQNPGISGEEEKMYLRVLKESGDRMLNTINDIIEMSKIESDQSSLNITSIEINELTDYFYNFFKPEAEEKGLELKLRNDLKGGRIIIETDKNKLGSVIANLLKNAIKFTSNGFVEFGCKIENEILTYYVKDTGMGIPSTRLTSIFHRFVQADLSITRPYEGVGLGLSIAKSYAELLGGKIEVESEEGVGSTFRCILPITLTSMKHVNSTNELKENFNKINGDLFLLVEDDDINIKYIQEILKNRGFKMIHARTGEEAIKFCRENQNIALVLMDIKLPVMNGYEATRQIKKLRAELPVIAQTAYAQDLDKELAFASGCSDYIIKPFKKEVLLSKILEHLRK